MLERVREDVGRMLGAEAPDGLRDVQPHVPLGALVAEGSRLDEVLLALSELELLGFLARGDGARYVPRESLPCKA